MNVFPSVLAESISFSGPTLLILLVSAAFFVGALFLALQRRGRGRPKEEALYREMVDRSSDLITRQTESGVYLFASPTSKRLLGYEPQELVGHSVFEIVHSDDIAAVREYLATVSREVFPHAFSYRLRHADGSHKWMETTSSRVESATGTAELLAYSRDIGERKQIEAHIEYAAYHDELTGLANRTLFKDRLTIALASARRFSRKMAVVFLDLDHFKRVNDTMGHRIGDLLLEETATRLHDCVRVTDTVARVGGDEFTILLSEIMQEDDAARVAGKILELLSNRFVLEGHHVYAGASIGIALYPQDGEDTETLLKNADSAMYRAKNSGRNCYKFATPGSNARLTERLTLENNLRRAFEREEFVVYYQPIFDVSSKRIVAMEALIRWDDPERGLLSPGEFLNVAEEARLMLPMGEWVMRSACRQARTWQDAGTPLRVSVNLSDRQFHHAELSATVERALSDASLDPRMLELEIPEISAAKDYAASTEATKVLRGLGVCLALDDFGLGNGSFGQIRKLAVDQVKLAPSLVGSVGHGSGDSAILSSVIAAARALDLSVVAKGVESQQQAELLRALQCDQMQGYLFGEPRPPDTVERTLRFDH